MAKKSKNKTKGGTSPAVQRATKSHQNQRPAKPFSGSNNWLTLADEARQTGQHDHSLWSQATKLRSMPISFISAGIGEPLKVHEQNEPDEDRADTAAPNPNRTPNTTEETNGPQSAKTHNEGATSRDTVPTSGATELDGSIFYYDTGRGSPKSHQEEGKGVTPHTPREVEPDAEKSDSEGDIILFKGRRNVFHKNKDNIDMDNIRTEIKAVEQEMKETTREKTAKKKNMRGRRGGRQAKAKRAAIDSAIDSADEEDDDGMLADYIANMRDTGEIDEVLQTSAALKEPEDQSENSSNSSDERNAEELSVEAILAAQLDQRTSNWASGESGIDYNDFDLMDRDRSSIRRKSGKGAGQKLDLRFADIDSETEGRLQAAWQSDRLRKADRKKEREQLRVLNLIGKKAEKSDVDDMSIKYPQGMSLEQVADELKRFLLSIDHSICLPPMDKHARKMIHELANKFNVKSKSIGKADQRRPTLFRTKRTLRFDGEAFDLSVRRIHRRYFPRLEYKGKSSQGQFSRNGYAEASYRDGEIVGASAPELSTDNRGRTMLEKMGWSTGTALGPEDNKGILLPVTQTMKRSKAGLG
ncbi:D111 G-patch domain [Cordyceps militaris]|uniref:Protein SQS1 n=1 Tax=Cordyceps militaris TaxID=73501 RepID=A0A2H4SNX4_CORMI|nr:D111 G-patch domain [Cordyceps militaris]